MSAGQLKSFVERIERLNEDRAAVGEDLKEVKSEAKGGGFDVPTIMAIVKIRKMDPEKRSEKNSLLSLYAGVMGIDPFS